MALALAAGGAAAWMASAPGGEDGDAPGGVLSFSTDMKAVLKAKGFRTNR
jgi:hypothetical protein